MNWKLIGLLSLTGVLMGVVTVYYIPTKYESLLGTPVYLLCAYVLARYAEGRFFAHGFLIGVINTAIVTLFHILMQGVYLAHHAPDAAKFAKIHAESGATVTQVMLMLGFFAALLSGLVCGLLTSAGDKILKGLANR